jgi:DNA polymerase I
MTFFTTNDFETNTEIEIDKSKLAPDCMQCGLYKKCKSPKMKYTGNGNKKILIINEAPSEEDDEYGTTLVSEEGQILKKKLLSVGISLNKDCWRMNAVSCVPSKWDGSNKKEINYCKPYVEKIIHELQPKFILLLGRASISCLLGDDFKNTKALRWRALCIPDQKYNAYLFPLLHPRSLKEGKDIAFEKTFERDLEFVASKLDLKRFKTKSYSQYVTILKDFKSVCNVLKRVLQRKTKIYIDYEATGLKPYRKGHKLVSISFAVSAKKAFAFPFNHTDFWTKEELKIIHKLWYKILADPKIKKMAHNNKFEDTWGAIQVGTRTNGWYFDTMMGSHILDNRSAYNALKFQVFIQFGVRPYDKHMIQYLKSKNGEFNTVEKAPLNDLLLYNGFDTLYGWMLYEQQKSALAGNPGLISAFKFFMKGIITMGEIQLGGIYTDEDYYDQQEIELEQRVAEIRRKLEKGREAKKFFEKYKRRININSNADLGLLFYEVLDRPAVYTAKDNYKTDKTTIEKLNLPFVDKLLDMKRLDKAKGTYLAQFKREVVNGKIHPFFDLHIPVSYRSSSSMPNFQNIPKRDAEIKTLLRKGLRPEPGCVLSEADFSGAEVITSCCFHKDKNFYRYLTDPTTDMHRDNATDLWMLPPDMLNNPDYDKKQKKLAKMIRFFAKSDWTFAQFYGDWFGSCAPMLWEHCVTDGLKLPNDITLLDHLANKGIYEVGEMTSTGPTPGSFMEHCAHVEDKMWNERFPEYTQWKKDIVKFYLKHGYIETFLGFKFTGYMSRNQCCNYPIQGTSFHLLVHTINELSVFLRKNNMKAKMVGQIHDAVISNVPVDEVEFYHQGLNNIVKSLQDKFEWLIIPMEIEAEISKSYEEGGSFADMDDYAICS